MQTTEKRIVPYVTPDGKVPFYLWLNGLRSEKVKEIIVKRIDRLRSGNYGDCKSVGGGVMELRFRMGVRVYFAEYGNILVLLLHGGDKNLQSRDIERAKEYWMEFKKDVRRGENDRSGT